MKLSLSTGDSMEEWIALAVFMMILIGTVVATFSREMA